MKTNADIIFFNPEFDKLSHDLKSEIGILYYCYQEAVQFIDMVAKREWKNGELVQLAKKFFIEIEVER